MIKTVVPLDVYHNSSKLKAKLPRMYFNCSMENQVEWVWKHVVQKKESVYWKM